MKQVVDKDIHAWTELLSCCADARSVVDTAGLRMFSNGYLWPSDIAEIATGMRLFSFIGWPISLQLNHAVGLTEATVGAASQTEKFRPLVNILTQNVVNRVKNDEDGILTLWNFVINNGSGDPEGRFRRHPEGGYLRMIDGLLTRTEFMALWVLSFWEDLLRNYTANPSPRLEEITDVLLKEANELLPDRVIQESDCFHGLGLDALDVECVMSGVEEEFTGRSFNTNRDYAMRTSPDGTLSEAGYDRAKVGTWRVEYHSMEYTGIMTMPLSQVVRWVDLKLKNCR